MNESFWALVPTKTQSKFVLCIYCQKEGSWYSYVCGDCMPIRDKIHKELLKDGIDSYSQVDARIRMALKKDSSPKKAFFYKVLDKIF